MATVYLRLSAPGAITNEDVFEVYRTRYDAEPFVTVRALGTMPSTREVSGSNRAHLGVAVDRRTGTLIAACAIDNLVKGTSGQAIQCANLVLGFDETEGLAAPTPVV
jgi:N-acetyl-gamma-glutamyl-phosphate reductase